MQMPLGATANMTSASCGGMGCTGQPHLSMKHAFADLLCQSIDDLDDLNMDRWLSPEISLPMNNIESLGEFDDSTMGTVAEG